MTKNEKENAVCALSSIRATISELEYYKRSGWLSDEGALDSARSAEEFMQRALGMCKKKRK